jgi:pantoate--beta-alanine ligase
MRTYTSNAQLQRALLAERRKHHTIAFVPTMGNLHEGHLDLVRKARSLCDVVVVSIFVNPMQFGANEDLSSYPRTLIADKEKLFAEGVQMVFAPDAEEIYPGGTAVQSQVQVPELSNTLCGASRPGHFTGVATVVTKLFNIVQPDVAVFGEKDFQQLSIIRKMVQDLCMPIEIVGVATARADDGLALSSRNGYLTAEQREVAPLLNEALAECREAIACGFDNYRELEARAKLKLIQSGFEPDYFEIRDARSLQQVTEQTEEVAILAAAKLGKPRLIDNVRLNLNPVTDWGMLDHAGQSTGK